MFFRVGQFVKWQGAAEPGGERRIAGKQQRDGRFRVRLHPVPGEVNPEFAVPQTVVIEHPHGVGRQLVLRPSCGEIPVAVAGIGVVRFHLVEPFQRPLGKAGEQPLNPLALRVGFSGRISRVAIGEQLFEGRVVLGCGFGWRRGARNRADGGLFLRC